MSDGVLVAGAGLPVTVLRPSIIVGERDSGWTQSFNVLYWPLRAFSRGAYAALPARRDAPVDVVPVDYVADAIFELSQAPEAEGVTYHLTAGANATSVGVPRAGLVRPAAAFPYHRLSQVRRTPRARGARPTPRRLTPASPARAGSARR
jgi:nucleoside-diphosphate-sugar epimerase